MWFLIYALTCIALVVMKALQVRRALAEGSYAWKTGIVILLVWLAVLLAGLSIACGGGSCSPETGLHWLETTLAGMPFPADLPLPTLPSETLAACLMLAIGVLSVYALGHSLGWLLHALRRLWPARA